MSKKHTVPFARSSEGVFTIEDTTNRSASWGSTSLNGKAAPSFRCRAWNYYNHGSVNRIYVICFHLGYGQVVFGRVKSGRHGRSVFEMQILRWQNGRPPREDAHKQLVCWWLIISAPSPHPTHCPFSFYVIYIIYSFKWGKNAVWMSNRNLFNLPVALSNLQVVRKANKMGKRRSLVLHNMLFIISCCLEQTQKSWHLVGSHSDSVRSSTAVTGAKDPTPKNGSSKRNKRNARMYSFLWGKAKGECILPFSSKRLCLERLQPSTHWDPPVRRCSLACG